MTTTGPTITKATARKWAREAAAMLPAVIDARRAALAVRAESLGKTYATRMGTLERLNYFRRVELAAAYGAARESYYHALNRWRAFEVR